MTDRMTDRERREAQKELARLKGWNQRGENDFRIKILERRIQRDSEANARDKMKGRHRRV